MWYLMDAMNWSIKSKLKWTFFFLFPRDMTWPGGSSVQVLMTYEGNVQSGCMSPCYYFILIAALISMNPIRIVVKNRINKDRTFFHFQPKMPRGTSGNGLSIMSSLRHNILRLIWACFLLLYDFLSSLLIYCSGFLLELLRPFVYLRSAFVS